MWPPTGSLRESPIVIGRLPSVHERTLCREVGDLGDFCSALDALGSNRAHWPKAVNPLNRFVALIDLETLAKTVVRRDEPHGFSPESMSLVPHTAIIHPHASSGFRTSMNPIGRFLAELPDA